MKLRVFLRLYCESATLNRLDDYLPETRPESTLHIRRPVALAIHRSGRGLTYWQTQSPPRHDPSSSRLFAPLPVPPTLLEHSNAEAERLAAAAAEKEGEIGGDGRSNPTCTERKAAGGGNVAVGLTPPPPAGGSSRGPAAGGRWCNRRSAHSGASRVPATGGTNGAAAVAAAAAWLSAAAAWLRRSRELLSTCSAGRFLDG